MLFKRFALASLVGSATVLAGCGRPATIATPAQLQPDQAAARPAQVVAADLQVAQPGAQPGPQAAESAITAETARTPDSAAALAAPADQALAAGEVPGGALPAGEGAQVAPDGAASGKMSAQFWWLFFRRPTPPPVATPRPVRPTPPPVATPRPVRPTPPPVYTPPPVRPTPPPVYTPPPVRPTPPPVYTPPPVRPTPPAVPVDGSRVQGTVGSASVNLYRVTGSDDIGGTLDGRSVYLTIGTGKLTGSIGSSGNVFLTRESGYLFLPTNISGSVGNRSLSLNLSGRNTYGSVGSVYFDTTISSDDRSLTGRYNGASVSVRTSGSVTSGYLGSYYVDITRRYDGRLTGWVGTKRVDLSGDVGPGGLLRRLPLIVADDWLVFSTMTRFFI